MFWMKWFKNNAKQETPKTPAEEQLEKIKEILFPPCVTEVDNKGNKYLTDYSADSNLEAALVDLIEGFNDATAQKTIKSVADRLYQVRQMLNVFHDMDGESKYVVVDDYNK